MRFKIIPNAWVTGAIIFALSMQLTIAAPVEKVITLTIDLQSGFSGQLVTVQIDGNDVAKAEAVMTNPSSGLGARHVYTTGSGLKRIEISVLDGNKRKYLRQDMIVDTDTAIGIQYMQYLDEKDIALTISRKPFIYD